MKTSSSGLWASLVLLVAAGCVTVQPGSPPPPRENHHPAYLHALADLRHSRAHRERPAAVSMQTAWDENVAIREIDAAMHEIREASIDDGKGLNDHPPVDAHLDWPGRLHRSLELLRAARHDCEQEEDNGFARGLRNRAIQHIDAAIQHIEQGIAANYPHYPPPAPVFYNPPPQPMPPPAQPGMHPSYLHALADLRHARAHLQRPANVNMLVAWDENVAIREIDAAINEIKQASIDDGKNLNDHPPIDARMDWRGRLHRTLELLASARHDCEQEEDNGFARGMRGRALQHINAAFAHVQKGIQDNNF